MEKIGFKRIEGKVYGLLVLSEKPLNSVEIQNELELSQSAVSNSLKTLTTYKTVLITTDKDKGCRTYSAVENTLEIVSQVFRKREKEFIRDYKLMAEKLLNKPEFQKLNTNSSRIKRLNSIVKVCQLGDMVINFIISLDELEQKHKNYTDKIIDNLPRAFDLLINTQSTAQEGAKIVKNIVGTKLRSYVEKFQENLNEK